jgi:hypothetical protein
MFSTLKEISAKVIEQVEARAHQKTMQPKRENQPTFFDLAVQQRGASNRVLETIAREVDFTEAETRVAATYRRSAIHSDASFCARYPHHHPRRHPVPSG